MLHLNITGFTEQEALRLMLAGLTAIRDDVTGKVQVLKDTVSGIPSAKPKTVAAKTTKSAAGVATGRKPMSAEAKQRIIDAQKKRWAKVKRANKAAQRAAQPVAAKRSRKRVSDAAMAAAVAPEYDFAAAVANDDSQSVE